MEACTEFMVEAEQSECQSVDSVGGNPLLPAPHGDPGSIAPSDF